ncbi:MAG: glycosyltransferase family 4 protein [Nitrospira sp.]|nr:glycosyltransferase family 4 protein [Nitrospira sp.]
MLSDLAFSLAQSGRDVSILTSRQAYDNPMTTFPSATIEQGVQIVRVWSTRFGRRSLVGRVLDYLTFYVSAFVHMLSMVQRGDLLVAKTDPPLISVVSAVVVHLRRAILMNWIQDLFPEVASALVGNQTKSACDILRWLRNWSLRTAVQNVVIGERMEQKLRDEGIAEHRITVIHNWADGNAIHPIDIADNELRSEWNLQNRFVVGYSGNLGRAHEFQTILDAMYLLRNDSHIVFLFIGGGAQRGWLKQAIEKRNLPNGVFKPYQPRERLSLSLGVPDLHLISLQPLLEGLIVPSKFYGIAAAGRPALYIGDQDGEIPMILHKMNCGISVGLNQSEKASDTIKMLAGNPEICKRYGRNARDIFEKRFDLRHAERAWKAAIHRASKQADYYM